MATPQNEGSDNTLMGEYFSKKAVGEGITQGNSDKFPVIRKMLAPAQTHNSILECGGGAGFYTQELLLSGYNVTVVDLSEGALKLNMENAHRLGKSAYLTTFTGDFNAYCEQNPELFDQVIFIKVLHHFDSLESMYKAFDCAIRLCRKGGQVIIFEPNGKNKLWKLMLSLTKDKNTGKPMWFYEKNIEFTTPDNFLKYFEQRGLPYEIGYHYVLPSFLINRFSKSSPLVKLNTWMEKGFFQKYAFNFSLVYTKE